MLTCKIRQAAEDAACYAPEHQTRVLKTELENRGLNPLDKTIWSLALDALAEEYEKLVGTGRGGIPDSFGRERPMKDYHCNAH